MPSNRTLKRPGKANAARGNAATQPQPAPRKLGQHKPGKDQLSRAIPEDGFVRALIDSAAEGILIANPDGRILLGNPAAERMFGYDPGLLANRSLEALIPRPRRGQHRKDRVAWFTSPRARPMGKGLDPAGVRSDGTEFPIEVSLNFIHTGGEILGVAFVTDISERRTNERTLLENREQLRRLTRALLASQETANRELARDLHDVFSQQLAAIGMDISLLQRKLKSRGEVEKSLASLGKRVSQLAADIHRAARQLHPAILELGLEPALRQECESFGQNTGIPTRFSATVVMADIPHDVALCLYRVAQESLRNVHKHSQSPHVKVRLESSPDGITLCVEDAGGGFELDQVVKRGGLGLISMEERVRLVNGKVTVQSARGKGTTVTAFVPLEKRPL